MCSPEIALGFQIAGGIGGAGAAIGAGKTNQEISESNALNLEQRAGEALESGKLDIQRQQIKTARLKGEQKVSFVSSGVAVGTGSPLDVLSDTARLGDLDVDIIKRRAERQATGLQLQAVDERLAGSLAKQRGKSRAFSTILTSAGTIAGSSLFKSGGTTVTNTG